MFDNRNAEILAEDLRELPTAENIRSSVEVLHLILMQFLFCFVLFISLMEFSCLVIEMQKFDGIQMFRSR